MKHFIFLFLLLSIETFGQSHSATLYFSDGTVKEGLANDVRIGSSKKIKFRENNKAPLEKIDIKDLRKIQYHGDPTLKPITLERMECILGYRKGETPIIEPISWLEKIYSGEISVYKMSFVSHQNASYNFNKFLPTSVNSFYLQYKEEMPALIYSTVDGGRVFSIKKRVQYFLGPYFKDLCPSLVEAYTNKTLQIKSDVMPFIEYYEKNCAGKATVTNTNSVSTHSNP